MRSRESSLWQWLTDGKPAGAILKRVENNLEQDFPDVVGVMNGATFLTELKVASVRKNGMCVIEITPGQIDFISGWRSAGGKSWLLISEEAGRRTLINGWDAKKFAKMSTKPFNADSPYVHIPGDELHSLAAIPINSIAMQHIARMASR